ncbi:hypothetical protein KQI48_10915 [Cellulomonas hominis]|uniref:hypothetical protein n=1 Tax=Cellulomonas hominis TaxID=156981 RepID=UPI001C1071C1|nr:hypothetical protein [Cellulomonas hominis]MBU5423176.1 hypothetical protein [Cellulomonas hominis]
MSQEERIARARAALAHAELRTGARSLARPADRARGAGDGAARGGAGQATRAGGVPAVTGGGADLADAVARVHGTAALAVVPQDAEPATSTPAPPARPRSAPPAGPVAVPDLPGRPTPSPARPAARGPVLLTDRPPLAVPPALTPLLPDGLRRGSTTAVLGSTSLVLAMVAAACTAREAWAAVVGQPSLGLLAAAQTGVALERLAVVPRPGVDTPTVVAALLDGIDVVVVGPGATLVDADRRRLMARARDRGSVLLSTAPWPGAGCVLTVEGGRWSGVGDGDGRLRAHELHVTRTGRGSAGQTQDLRLVLPLEVGTHPYGLPAAPAPAPAPTPAPAERAGLRLVG